MVVQRYSTALGVSPGAPTTRPPGYGCISTLICLRSRIPCSTRCGGPLDHVEKALVPAILCTCIQTNTSILKFEHRTVENTMRESTK